MNPIDAVDLFAGPGGWSVAASALGIRELGIELDPAACATRAAAGHLTIRADVAAMPTVRMAGRIRGLIASPPCTTFAVSGKRAGVDDLPMLHQGLDDLAAGRDTRAQLAAACSDPRTTLVVEPLRCAMDLRPEWVALEQVPAVLPLWRRIAEILGALGYSAWSGVLNAADYGVPQTRRRAVLVASRIRRVGPPQPTHYDPRKGACLWGDPWTSMADALGWTPGEKTAVRTNSGNGYAHDYQRDVGRPAPTVTSRFNRWRIDNPFGGVEPLTVAQAGMLQTFPADYPWHGDRTQQQLQAGNAVPPLLALHVLAAATGVEADGRLLEQAPLAAAV